MATPNRTPFQVPIPCRTCSHSVTWPRWRKLAEREYAPMCWPCFSASVLIVAMARQAALEVRL